MYISAVQASDDDSEKSSGRYAIGSHFPFSSTPQNSLKTASSSDYCELGIECATVSFRTLLRVAAPTASRDPGAACFSDLSPMGADSPDSSALRKSRKVVEYFWIPTDQE